jgi:hypothetical protein
MPNQTVFVKPAATVTWAYAWSTKNYDAILGHSLLTGVPTSPLVFGSNLHKPNRAIKLNVGGPGKTKSTFVEAGKEDDARAANWKVMIGSVKRQPKGKNTKAVAIKLQTGLYHCWLMPTKLHTELGATGLADLGIVAASTVNAEDRVYGAQGYILTEPALNIPAGTRFSMRRFQTTYVDAAGNKHRTFAAPDSPNMTGA